MLPPRRPDRRLTSAAVTDTSDQDRPGAPDGRDAQGIVSCTSAPDRRIMLA